MSKVGVKFSIFSYLVKHVKPVQQKCVKGFEALGSHIGRSNTKC